MDTMDASSPCNGTSSAIKVPVTVVLNPSEGPTYTSSAYLVVNSDDQNCGGQCSVVCLDIDPYPPLVSMATEDGDQESADRPEEDPAICSKKRDAGEALQVPSDTCRRTSQLLQGGGNRASKDLKELQAAIQKAKEAREVASKELQLLQDALSQDQTCPDHVGCPPESRCHPPTGSSSSKRTVTSVEGNLSPGQLGLQQIQEELVPTTEDTGKEELLRTISLLRADCQTLKIECRAAREDLFDHQQMAQTTIEKLKEALAECQAKLSASERREADARRRRASLESALSDLQFEKLKFQEALSELQLRSEKDRPERSSSVSYLGPKNEDAFVKLQEESKRNVAELTARLERQEEEVRRLRSENTELRSRLAEVLVCGHQVNGDIATEETDCEDDEKSAKSPRKPVVSTNQDRLQQRLQEAEERCRQAEERADHLNLLFNQKLIELNKLQLTLSNQTKEMIQLEKAYFHARCHLTKGSRSPASRMSPSPKLTRWTTP